MSVENKPVLVTGSTGYVGGRLVPQLLDSGYRVRVMGRSLSKLKSRPWASNPNIEIIKADALEYDSLLKAVNGCWACYYLIHSMGHEKKDFELADREAATNMTRASSLAGLRRIIYLGGLGADEPALSRHLRSRTEVAKILKSGSVPVTFLRAAMILGSGSASFEILRYLAERLPIMITTRWIRTPCQPIAIRNVLYYLKGCLEKEETIGKTFDIGGPDILTYQSLIEIYTQEAGLPRRWIIPVPLMTPRLSAYWINLVTPVPSSLANPLVEGLRNPVICQENRMRSILPQELLSCRMAIRLALERIVQQRIETRWSDAGRIHSPEWIYSGDAPYAGGTILESGFRSILEATPGESWKPIAKIGGQTGWYFASTLWELRGEIDSLFGGAGLRRGRRHPERLYPGDALDFWRVLDVRQPNYLLLLAEMKMPGEITLEFRVHSLKDGRTEVQQLFRFLPKGLLGIIYWYSFYPLHKWIYRGMLREISRRVGRPVYSGPERFAPGRYFIFQSDQGIP